MYNSSKAFGACLLWQNKKQILTSKFITFNGLAESSEAKPMKIKNLMYIITGCLENEQQHQYIFYKNYFYLVKQH